MILVILGQEDDGLLQKGRWKCKEAENAPEPASTCACVTTRESSLNSVLAAAPAAKVRRWLSLVPHPVLFHLGPASSPLSVFMLYMLPFCQCFCQPFHCSDLKT